MAGMKTQMVMMVPQMVIMGWINFFFQGFVLSEYPRCLSYIPTHYTKFPPPLVPGCGAKFTNALSPPLLISETRNRPANRIFPA